MLVAERSLYSLLCFDYLSNHQIIVWGLINIEKYVVMKCFLLDSLLFCQSAMPVFNILMCALLGFYLVLC